MIPANRRSDVLILGVSDSLIQNFRINQPRVRRASAVISLQLGRVKITAKILTAFFCEIIVGALFTLLSEQPSVIKQLHSTCDCTVRLFYPAADNHDIFPNKGGAHRDSFTVRCPERIQKLEDGIISFVHPCHPWSHALTFLEHTCKTVWYEVKLRIIYHICQSSPKILSNWGVQIFSNDSRRRSPSSRELATGAVSTDRRRGRVENDMTPKTPRDQRPTDCSSVGCITYESPNSGKPRLAGGSA